VIQLSAAKGPSFPSNIGGRCLKKVVDEQPTTLRSPRTCSAAITAAQNYAGSGIGGGGDGGGGGGGVSSPARSPTEDSSTSSCDGGLSLGGIVLRMNIEV
jgi:hypothetical protein